MRSNLVHSAESQVASRFLLATIAMRAVRVLHIDSTRTEDTANEVFTEIANGKYILTELPPVASPQSMDLLITSAA